MNEKMLRNKILDLVKEYIAAKPKEQFVPGRTYINYAGRVYDEKELAMLVDSSLDFWLTTGRYAAEFEKKLARFVGVEYALLTNSGSSANLLAISALTSPLLEGRRLKPGDEVITTPMTFIASLNTIIHAGAKPVMVDVDLKTRNIDIEKIKAAITPRTKAIVPVHFAGIPVDLDPLYEIAEKHNLRVLEDCAHAIGSHYKDKIIGSFGDTQAFSFHPNKIMTTGEGGCISTRDEELAKKISIQRSKSTRLNSSHTDISRMPSSA